MGLRCLGIHNNNDAISFFVLNRTYSSNQRAINIRHTYEYHQVLYITFLTPKGLRPIFCSLLKVGQAILVRVLMLKF